MNFTLCCVLETQSTYLHYRATKSDTNEDCKIRTVFSKSRLHMAHSYSTVPLICTLHACNMSSFLIQQRSRENCIQYLPIGQSVIQDSIICPQNKHYVKPPLWEEVTAMIVNNLASLSHSVLHLIYELQQTYTAHMLNHKFQLYHTSTMYTKYRQLRYRVVEIYQGLEEWDASIFRVGRFYWIKDHYKSEDTVPVTIIKN